MKLYLLRNLCLSGGKGVANHTTGYVTTESEEIREEDHRITPSQISLSSYPFGVSFVYSKWTLLCEIYVVSHNRNSFLYAICLPW